MHRVHIRIAVAVLSAGLLLGIFQNCAGGFQAQKNFELSSFSRASCTFNDKILASGETVSGFSSPSVPFAQSCDAVKIQVTCENGNLNPTSAVAACAPLAGASCPFNGRSIPSGDSVLAYQAVSVPAGSTCVSQTRRCVNGTLDGTFQFASCSVNAPLDCTFNNTVIPNGMTTQGYPTATVPFGQTCTRATITCTNGILNPANHVAACTVQPGLPCSFNGQMIASGGTVPGYPSATVPYGQTCTPSTLTCTNGTLSPANHVAVCSVMQAATNLPALKVEAVNKTVPTVATPQPLVSIPGADPNKIFPDLASLRPDGKAYTDTVPDTLDLAEMAKAYLQGMSRTLIRIDRAQFERQFSLAIHEPARVEEFRAAQKQALDAMGAGRVVLGPPGIVEFFGTPNMHYLKGVENWGKVVEAMDMARKMSGYDLDDRDGTFSAQLTTTRDMIDPNVNWAYTYTNSGAWISVPLVDNVISGSRALEGLIEIRKHRPSPELDLQILKMLAFIKAQGTQLNQNGLPMRWYMTMDPATIDDFAENFVGKNGRYWQPFHSGTLIRPMAAWHMLMPDQALLNISAQLSNFLLHYSQGGVQDWFWQTLGHQPAGTGHFAGHVHGYLTALMGLLWEAEARLKVDPNDARARQMIQFANTSYVWARDVNGEGVLGNFGEVCALGDMLRIAVKLTELGAGDYNEDIDRYLRNQMIEQQITRANSAMIANNVNPGNNLVDRIRDRVIGLFYEDAAHPFALPFDPSQPNTIGMGNFAFAMVACGFGNPMRGIYEAWRHIVQIFGERAQVNLLLNRASPYFDVKSEIPYRGSVHIVTKANIGPITTLDVRIPDWTTKAQVKVALNGVDLPAAQWSWKNNTYVSIPAVKASSTYTISFPTVIRQLTVTQRKAQNQGWYESNVNDPKYPFTISTYTGVFRGNTLVDAAGRPTSGTNFYQRQALAALGGSEAAAPTVTRARFALSPSFERPGIAVESTPQPFVGSLNALLGDVSGDGRADIVVRNTTASTAQLYISNGRGFDSATALTVLPATVDLWLADVNGDLRADLVARNQSTGGLSVYFGNTTGLATSASTISLSIPKDRELWLADVNGDGRADLIARDTTQSVTPNIFIYSSSGQTWNSAATSYGPIGPNVDLVIGDVNGDGRADLVGRDIQQTNSANVFVHVANGTSWTPAPVSSGPVAAAAKISLADFDGDGRLDLVAVDPSSEVGNVYLSVGRAFNVSADARITGIGAGAVLKFADVNGGGKTDVVRLNPQAGQPGEVLFGTNGH